MAFCSNSNISKKHNFEWHSHYGKGEVKSFFIPPLQSGEPAPKRS